MSKRDITVRLARPEDAEACAAIYAPYVESTPISFEYTPPSSAVMRARIERTLPTHPWFVASEGTGPVLGYAYAGPFRERAAYQWCAEVSVYVVAKAQQQGVGRRLYLALFHLLEELGHTQVVAGATMPNEASRALHETLGFREIARFPRIGRKLDGWHDVVFWQLDLRPPPWGKVPPPRTLAEMGGPSWVATMLG